MFYRLVSLCLLGFLAPWSVEAQLSFTNRSINLSNPILSSGFSIGICDLNNDGLDDLLRFNRAKNLEIEFQQADQSFERILLGSMSNDVVYSVSSADIDNNGFNDIITGGFYEPVKILWATDDGTDYIKDTLDGPQVFMQGANFSDIDNDGWIDYFICHDDFISQPYRNQQDGQLVYDETLFQAVSTVNSNNSGNYSAVWTDYDSDGDIDMYLSKCRLGVSDPMNGDRINLLYRNEGGGAYTEVAEESGIRPLAQSWASDFADFDNDGDMDAFVINHDKDCHIYENDGTGNFSIVNVKAGVEEDLSKFKNGLQVIVRDFDNDGFVDIFLTTFFTHFLMLHNNGDFTFTKVENPFGFSVEKVQSAAVGDLNNDGFVDILAGFSEGVNVPNNSMPDRMYINDGNNNNWIRLQLEGRESNVNAIGSRLELYGAWGMQTREIRSGESYGIMNSMHKIFGIGNYQEIDSLVISWPSGSKSVIPNPPINRSMKVRESTVTLDKDIFLCEGDSVLIDGQYIRDPGMYQELSTATVLDSLYNINVLSAMHETTSVSQTICFGGSLEVGADRYSAAGDYNIVLTSVAGCDSIINLSLSVNPEIILDVVSSGDSGAGDGTIEISVSGGLAPYNIQWDTGASDVFRIEGLAPGTYTATVIDANDCESSVEVKIDFTSATKNELLNGVEVYPIPTSDNINIQLPEGHNFRSFQIYNVLGQKLSEVQILNNYSTLSLSDAKETFLLGRLVTEDNQSSDFIKIIRSER